MRVSVCFDQILLCNSFRFVRFCNKDAIILTWYQSYQSSWGRDLNIRFRIIVPLCAVFQIRVLGRCVGSLLIVVRAGSLLVAVLYWKILGFFWFSDLDFETLREGFKSSPAWSYTLSDWKKGFVIIVLVWTNNERVVG
ncbi:hypothetical protein HanIR_Chr17g0894011 [Helianthus annuus]|nr:hypothetical protein HanIR_Chr17g0894011 [Helianthus annuus]